MSDHTLPINPPEGLSSPNHPDNGEDIESDIPENDFDDEDNVLADDEEVDLLTEGINTDAPVLAEEGDVTDES